MKHHSHHAAPSTLRRFLASEAAGGVVLMASAAVALALANSPWADSYHGLLAAPIAGHTALHWINDGLMAVFFLLVGLEIKRELVDGHLRHWSARVLPGVGALGGMLAPALIYAYFNGHSPEMARGWAIPSATDIAFALGVLALLGDRVPGALKVFLTALAILDDLGAIVIIAIFYAGEPAAQPLLGAGVTLFLLLGLNLFEVKFLPLYLLLGVALWHFVQLSGVHATLAGVLLAVMIPLRLSGPDPDEHTPLHRLENALGPFVAFIVLPLFGFANAGVALGGGDLAAAGAPVLLGVALGLFIGKQAGVFAAIALAIGTRIASRPPKTGWVQLYGVSVLCGVGFTMSLFIGQIAFEADEGAMRATKIGVLAGSAASIALGSLVLWIAARRAAARRLLTNS
ncbi:Na+/H+ antiporter NhaA [Methylosinus sp. H3A]|uniref:Na+/H+ antiporter NhaA n=1 Tax=Methylosinus sp. H3A TaxID=2785786 RepID=UPI0018C2DFF5|nr:Na+/H+ antiporter NhaA [Methylosinus sp. H3A]MBG0811687.1 Na+/H+ antiporter NhaA [Methylosinus sp. H3A]